MPDQWGRRLEGWPNTAARLAGWLEESDPASAWGVILYVMDSLMPPALTDHTTCPGLVMIYYIECTQHTVMSEVTQGRHGLVLL